MQIMELWIISTSGLPFYRYSNENSSYKDLDEILFSGLLVAINYVSQSFERDVIESIELEGGDAICILKTKMEILVVAIITNENFNWDRLILKELLKYIGQQFTQLFNIEKLSVKINYKEVQEIFSDILVSMINEIGVLIDIKKDKILELYINTLEQNLTPELFSWNIEQILWNSEPEEIKEIIPVVQSMIMNVNNLDDNNLKDQMIKVLFKINQEIKIYYYTRERQQIFGYCKDNDLYEQIQFNLVRYNKVFINSPSIPEMIKNVNTVSNEITKDDNISVLLVIDQFNINDFLSLARLPNKIKIIIWSSGVPDYIQELNNKRETPIKFINKYCGHDDCPKLMQTLDYFASQNISDILLLNE